MILSLIFSLLLVVTKKKEDINYNFQNDYSGNIILLEELMNRLKCHISTISGESENDTDLVTSLSDSEALLCSTTTGTASIT